MPATTPIRVPRQQLADLKTIAGVDVETLGRIARHLAELKSPPVQPKQLSAEMMKAAPELPQHDVDAVIRQMLALHSLIGQRRLDVDQLLAGLLEGLKLPASQWKADEINAWIERQPLVRDFLTLDTVRIVSKALDLSYEYANLLRTARIITDLRPVFTLDAKGIDGAVISHKLFIRYDNVEGLKTFTMTLDEEDVKRLKDECERALQKTETMAAQFTKGAPIRTIIPGREDE